jgi:group I intron endonuclease
MLRLNLAPYGVVYIVTNLVTGKSYVGQTTKSISERWSEHCKRAGKFPGLSGALARYGTTNFTIAQIDVGFSLQDLHLKEILWIQRIKTQAPMGYNLTRGGEGSEAAKAPRGPRTQETKDRIRATLAKNHPQGTCRGKTPEVVERTAQWHRGSKRSEETCTRMKDAWVRRRVRLGIAPPVAPKRTLESRARSSEALKLAWAKRKGTSHE